MQPRIVEVRQRILKKNDEQARALRLRFADAGVFVVSLVSSPGAGKTTLLRQTLIELGKNHRVAALVGDLATENDANRLAESGAPAKQIITGTVCHLEAEMIENALSDWDLSSLDFLFIENVGNLVCPASYDLGENIRVVLFSTTEGEDKPLKYPTIFNTADITLITKMDLATAVEFDREKARQSVQNVRPGMKIIELSTRSGHGMGQWIDLLTSGAMQLKMGNLFMLIEAPIGNIFADDAALHPRKTIDWLDLTWQECARRALQKPTRGGMEVRILLRLGVTLRHGDLLCRGIDQTAAPIAVHLLPCPVVVARPRDTVEWATLGYELGNLHVPIEVLRDRIITISDGPVEALFYELGLPFETEMRRFEPSLGTVAPITFAAGFTVKGDRPSIGQNEPQTPGLQTLEAASAPKS